MYNIITMDKFEFFSKFNDAVLIINDKNEVLYKNNAFRREFKDIVDLSKFSHHLSFDICALEGGNVDMYSPIIKRWLLPRIFLLA